MNSTSQKKRAEEEVLRMVYDLERFEPVEASERPDFVLRRKAASERFGVEVTRFYESEASARLEHISGYVGELLGGGKHRHKDDVKALVVDNVTISNPEGSVVDQIRAIMVTLPLLADHIQMIAQRIETKSDALSVPRVDLTHVNLIVLDKTGRFAAADPEHVATALLKGAVVKAVGATTFREVFYVVDVAEKRTVFYPLRMLLLVSELFMFNEARGASGHEEVIVESRDEELTLFGSFMRSRDVPVVLTGGTPEEGVQVILGNTGVLVADDNVSIRDYTDWPLPQTRLPPERTFSETFLTFYEKYAAEHVFKSGLVFDVRKTSAT
jgi:hypothetical protein